jgi:hypothetical protein
MYIDEGTNKPFKIKKKSKSNIWVECSLGYHNLGGLKTHKVHQN